ncbi:hypothetical protein AVEN_195802-1 [Araneus ventricosus]|uniref:Uncharacterized protein n=1 Tax=Araneus ventricosus TaxID=182803 RepID=A0A4Y2GGS2_ARAVE|nr:hypothetical protein AVEN_195802-1 [Araneus ventricosus]
METSAFPVLTCGRSDVSHPTGGTRIDPQIRGSQPVVRVPLGVRAGPAGYMKSKLVMARTRKHKELKVAEFCFPKLLREANVKAVRILKPPLELTL